MVAMSVRRLEHIVAQAETIPSRLPSEVERVQRLVCAGREQVNRVAVALSLEELPHSADFHPRQGIFLHGFHRMVQVQRLLFTLQQLLLEIPLVAHVPTIEHVRVDVTPDLRQLRQCSDAAVKVGNRRYGNIRTNLRRCELCRRRPFLPCRARGRPQNPRTSRRQAGLRALPDP